MSEHSKTAYKRDWLYFTVIEDEEEGGWYVSIFDRQGKDVATLPKGDELYSSRTHARNEAIRFIQKKDARSRELPPP